MPDGSYGAGAYGRGSFGAGAAPPSGGYWPLATLADYEMLIGPVAPADEARVTYLLTVASAVVVSVAPGLLPWMHYDASDPEAIDPGPVPPNAVLVTCQVAARLVEQPAGADGAVSAERVGWVSTSYTTDWSMASGLLPAGWQLLLKPWRFPEMASIRLVVPHPTEGFWDGWWWPGDLERHTDSLRARS